MTLAWVRAACSHPALSGIPRAHFGELLEELAPKWLAARESALRERRGGFTGRRETYPATHLAIAGLVSDRSARRQTRRKPSTELMLARSATC